MGIEYLEEDLDIHGADAEEDLLMDPLLSLDEDETAVRGGFRGSRGPMESEVEVDLMGLDLDDPTGGSDPMDVSSEDGDLRLDLTGAEGQDGGGRFADTAVVSRQELDLLAAAPDDEEDLQLDEMLHGSMEDDDLFRDELSQMQETAELVASLRGGEEEDEIGPEETASISLAGSGFDLAPDDEEAEEDTATHAVVEPRDDGHAVAAVQSSAFAEVDVGALADDMEGATFFIDQGLYEEALSELRELIDQYGEHPHLMARIESVKALMSEEGPPADQSPDPDEVELPVVSRPGGGRMNIPRGESDAFQQFKDGVAKQVGEDDAETHFDVGIAYKEMGMFRDAIGEFKAAMRPHNEVQCHVMIAHCYRDQGDTSEAINEYKKALYCEQITENEQVDLYYQMGVAYEGLDDPREAVYYYDKVVRMVAGYRDVDARLAALRAKADPSKTPSQNDVDSAFDDLINADHET